MCKNELEICFLLLFLQIVEQQNFFFLKSAFDLIFIYTKAKVASIQYFSPVIIVRLWEMDYWNIKAKNRNWILWQLLLLLLHKVHTNCGIKTGTKIFLLIAYRETRGKTSQLPHLKRNSRKSSSKLEIFL